jgi:hypothetical protein
LRFTHKKLTREGSKGKAGRRERKGAKTQGRKENQKEREKEREREREKKEIKNKPKQGIRKQNALVLFFPSTPFPFL